MLCYNANKIILVCDTGYSCCNVVWLRSKQDNHIGTACLVVSNEPPSICLVLYCVFMCRRLLQKKVHLCDAFHRFRKYSDSGISSWDWNLSGQHSTYHALFPRAWTVYDGMALWSCGKWEHCLHLVVLYQEFSFLFYLVNLSTNRLSILLTSTQASLCVDCRMNRFPNVLL